MSWDYDKLFQEGNLIGFYVPLTGENIAKVIDDEEEEILQACYRNELLSYPNYYSENHRTRIQYIVQLDKYGNMVERLFDRVRDFSNIDSMPELKDDMIVKVVFEKNYSKAYLAYIDRGMIFYSGGGYDCLAEKDEWEYVEIVEVYDSEVTNYSLCINKEPIWRSHKYQYYLNMNKTS